MQFDNDLEPITLGTFHELKVIRKVSFGYYLESLDGDILLPIKSATKEIEIGNDVEAFIYKDSENKLIATMIKPKVILNHCALLEVMDVNHHGAFLDWGIQNQLLVPYSEQPIKMYKNQKYLVYLYLDEVSNRLVATMRIEKYFNPNPILVKEKELVDLIIYQKTDLGFKAIINQFNMGLLYHDEFSQNLSIGDKLPGYIQCIRQDSKIDLSLKQLGFDRLKDIPGLILKTIKKNEKGFLPLHDKSSPEEIKQILKISKGDFKKAVGMLYKQKEVLIKQDGIYLNITPMT